MLQKWPHRHFRRKNIAMSDLLVFRSITDFQNYRASIQGRVGIVPTMGALHAGHASLIERSVRENDVTIVSIYVNPTQFNNPNDLAKYPRTWDADLQLIKKCGAQVVLAPTYEEIYPDQYHFRLTEDDFSTLLCGAHRPGHFTGVLTIVMKLFLITQADQSYFGEKDFQQLQLIRNMVGAFFLKVNVNGCPTLREESGLAMSSRNTTLTAAGKEKASAIYQALTTSATIPEARKRLVEAGFEVEYLEEHFNRRFVAAFIEGVRLIDNVQI